MTDPTLDALRDYSLALEQIVNSYDGPNKRVTPALHDAIEFGRAVLSAALASAMTIPLPTTDDTHAVIEEGRRVSDNSASTPSDLRFALNAAIYQLEEQREMYRARLRETEQDAKLRVKAALASASVPDGAAGPFGYCMGCYHPLDKCSYCDAPRASASAGQEGGEVVVCLRRFDPNLRQMVFEPLPEAAPPRAPETPSQPQDWNNKALWATGAPETPQTCETGWQPIESCPRNQPVVVFSRTYGLEAIIATLLDDGVWVDKDNEELPIVRPTHWAPPPPSESRT